MANIRQSLEAVERNIVLDKCLGYGQAAGSGADNAVTLHCPIYLFLLAA